MAGPVGLLYVSPHPGRSLALPTRPRALLEAFIAAGAFEPVVVVNRVRPSVMFSRRAARAKASLVRRSTLAGGVTLVEHPLPFGRLEDELLQRLVVERLGKSIGGLVLWLSDPKSAGALSRLQGIADPGFVRIFDAYDAWDLSPLVRGRWRRRAVEHGYRAAARSADIVFANTEYMARRMHGLGATRVTVLPNGSPPVQEAAPFEPDPAERYLLYVGRIHERVDAGLLEDVAEAFPSIPIRLVGPVEREPSGWADLVARPNVILEGVVVGELLRGMLMNAAALLIPHRVDDYTRSQDAMKAWDALAVGTPVVATPVPPVETWPTGLAEIGADRAAFVAGVRKILDGRSASDRATRLRFAVANGWDVRAATALREIATVLDR